MHAAREPLTSQHLEERLGVELPAGGSGAVPDSDAATEVVLEARLGVVLPAVKELPRGVRCGVPAGAMR